MRIGTMFFAAGLLSWLPAPAGAARYDDMFVFGDSFSDTGSLLLLSDGPPSVAVLAQRLGISMVTLQEPKPGRRGVNYAQSGARIVAPGRTEQGAPILSIAQQIDRFARQRDAGALTFDPDTTLFFMAGGLNDHSLTPAGDLIAAYATQIMTLHSLGARHIAVALLPASIPGFTDSAAALNPPISAMVPALAKTFPDLDLQLSLWGPYYDLVFQHPLAYGITDISTPCVDLLAGTSPCSTVASHYFFFNQHPSARVHQIVGDALYHQTIEATGR